MIRKGSLNNKDIIYNLTYKKVKNINLRIKLDGSVHVSYPDYVPLGRIEDFILSKGDFILSSIEKFKMREDVRDKPKDYVSGESFRILGKDLRLKVDLKDRDEIYSDGVFLYLNVKKDDYARKERIVSDWIKKKTLEIFMEITKETHRAFEKYGVPFPEMRIRKMVSKWGSCQPLKGIITLNSRLIEYPRVCIEYVVMHEFCHFIHPNHSKSFYILMSVMMPDWKHGKNLLEKKVYF